MKLKPIKTEIAVHTPTEEAANELLAILHENGYKWLTEDLLVETTNWHIYKKETAYGINPNKRVGYCFVDVYVKEDIQVLSLDEFKRMYCEEEKSQPKFEVGDRVVIQESYYKEELHGQIGVVTNMPSPFSYYVEIDKTIYQASAKDLEPYTEPETKEETMEAKELNLCELLKGHEGEEFFSLAYGKVVLNEIRRGTQRGDSSEFLCVRATAFDSGTIIVNPNGKLRNAGVVDLVPSRALYEQYPLDAYTAWMKWQEEQKKYTLVIVWNCPDKERAESINHIYFRTPADRDKCIEEIKAIIEKYSKK